MVVEFDFRPFSMHLALRGLAKEGRKGQFYSVKNVYDSAVERCLNGDIYNVDDVENILNGMATRKGGFVIRKSNPSGFSGYRFDGEGYHEMVHRGAKGIAELMRRVYESQRLTPEMMNMPITI